MGILQGLKAAGNAFVKESGYQEKIEHQKKNVKAIIAKGAESMLRATSENAGPSKEDLLAKIEELEKLKVTLASILSPEKKEVSNV